MLGLIGAPLPTDLQPMSVTAADGATLAAFTRAATGDSPTVVLAHGWCLTHRSWLPVIEALPSTYGIVAYDQRGHGDSELGHDFLRGTGHETLRQLGSDLEFVISEAAPSGDLILGGHSMGGMTVMAYAGGGGSLGRVRQVALVATAAGGLRGLGLPAEKQVWTALAHVPFRMGPATRADRVVPMLFARGASPSAIDATLAEIRRTRTGVMAGFIKAITEHDEYAALPDFASVPTTVLVGTKDKLTPPVLAERILDKLPSATLVELDGKGHMLTYEATDEVATALTR